MAHATVPFLFTKEEEVPTSDAAAAMMCSRTHVSMVFRGMAFAGSLTALGTAAATAGAAGAVIRRHVRVSGQPRVAAVLPTAIVVLAACCVVEEVLIHRSGLTTSAKTGMPFAAAQGLQVAGVVTGVGVFVGGIAGAVLSRCQPQRLLLPWLLAMCTALCALDWSVVETVRAARIGLEACSEAAGRGQISLPPMPCNKDSRDDTALGMAACATGTGLGILISAAALLRSWYQCARVKTVTTACFAMISLIAVLGKDSTEAIRKAQTLSQRVLKSGENGALPVVVGDGLRCAGVVAALSYVAPGILLAAAVTSISSTNEIRTTSTRQADAVCLAIVLFGGVVVSLLGWILTATLVGSTQPHMRGAEECVEVFTRTGNGDVRRWLIGLGLLASTAALAAFSLWATYPLSKARERTHLPVVIDRDMENATQLVRMGAVASSYGLAGAGVLSPLGPVAVAEDGKRSRTHSEGLCSVVSRTDSIVELRRGSGGVEGEDEDPIGAARREVNAVQRPASFPGHPGLVQV